MSIQWSTYQQAILDDARTGAGHAVVVARAGAAKTTTLVEAIHRLPSGKRTLAVAFNKSIATELQSRVPAGVECATLHAFGFRAVKTAVRRLRVDGERLPKSVRQTLLAEGFPRRFDRVVERAARLSKSLPRLATLPELEQIAIERCDVDTADSPTVAAAARAVLEDQLQLQDGMVDFDDMIWLPLVLDVSIPRYDVVVVDEVQDLSAAQVELALRACRKSGRVLAAGDDMQAIYAFRGADQNSIPNLIGRLGARTFALPISYRCARAIVEWARQFVPDFEPAPGARDGIVRTGSLVELERDAAPGDFVLSRTNAPLVPIALDLLRAGRSCAIMGRDFSQGLTELVSRAKSDTPRGLYDWLARWEHQEAHAREMRRKSADDVHDRAAALRAVGEGASTISEIRDRLARLYSAQSDSARQVTLATTHKAKGLERDRVWMLASTYKPSQGGEEANLAYVAATRARNELVRVVE